MAGIQGGARSMSRRPPDTSWIGPVALPTEDARAFRAACAARGIEQRAQLAEIIREWVRQARGKK